MAGANLNSSDCHFGTPLHVAACQGSVNCAQSLLQAGQTLFSFTWYTEIRFLHANGNTCTCIFVWSSWGPVL